MTSRTYLGIAFPIHVLYYLCCYQAWLSVCIFCGDRVSPVAGIPGVQIWKWWSPPTTMGFRWPCMSYTVRQKRRTWGRRCSGRRGGPTRSSSSVWRGLVCGLRGKGDGFPVSHDVEVREAALVEPRELKYGCAYHPILPTQLVTIDRMMHLQGHVAVMQSIRCWAWVWLRDYPIYGTIVRTFFKKIMWINYKWKPYY